MIYAADLSNYTSDLSVASLEAWKGNGITHAIVQAIDPPAGYPPGKTRGQVVFLAANGFTVDAYIWLWFALGLDDIHHKLSLLDGLPVQRLWLDVEDLAAENYNQGACEEKVAQALAACDGWQTARGVTLPTGIYTGWWYWTDQRYMGKSTAFSDRDLWDSNYDGHPVSDETMLRDGRIVPFEGYGGWERRAIKQYWGTMGLHDIWGIDMNVLSAEEEARLTGGGGDTTDEERAEMQAQIDNLQTERDGLVNSMGYIAGDLLHPVVAQKTKGTKAMQALVAGIRGQADQFGIRHA